MRRLLLLLLPLFAGCVTATGGNYLIPPESAVRLPLRQKATALVEKLLKRDGWVGILAASENSGVIASSAQEGWSEDTFRFDVTAYAADAEPVLIPVADYTPILENLRKKLRDLVEDNGGEQVDWQVLEGYHERTLDFQYKQGGVNGRVRVRMAPRWDRPDELVTRVEFVVREQ